MEIKHIPINNNLEKSMTNKWWTSSANSQELSLTIKALLVGWIPIMVALGQVLDLNITETALTEIIQAIVSCMASLMFLYGIGRKIYFWIWR